jgi:hypothetical protein
MQDLPFKRSAFVALLAAVLTVPGSAASPESSPSAEALTATQNSASLFPRLPEEGADSRLPDSRFNLLRGGSAGGAASGGMSASETPSARVLDQLDRRRNWIYATQSPSSFELSAEQALGVRSAEPADRNGESEGWLAEFFHDRGTERPLNRSTDDIFSSSLQTPSVQSALFGATPTSAPGISGFNLGMAPFQAAPAESSSGGSLRGIGGNLSLPEQGLSRVPTSIRELLASPGSLDPLATGFDPINLGTDTTQLRLNPTAPTRMADLDTTAKTVDALLERPIRDASSTRPSYLDNFNSRMMGNSSLAPAIRAPGESQPAERPLDFGRFPSRKF